MKNKRKRGIVLLEYVSVKLLCKPCYPSSRRQKSPLLVVWCICISNTTLNLTKREYRTALV